MWSWPVDMGCVSVIDICKWTLSLHQMSAFWTFYALLSSTYMAFCLCSMYLLLAVHAVPPLLSFHCSQLRATLPNIPRTTWLPNIPSPIPLCFSDNCSITSLLHPKSLSFPRPQHHLPLELFSSTCWARVRHNPSPSANTCFAMMLRCLQDPAPRLSSSCHHYTCLIVVQ